MSIVKKRPRKSKLVVRDDLPVEVQSYTVLESSTSPTNNSSKQLNNNTDVLLDIKVEKLSDVEDNDEWSADAKIVVHDVKKEVVTILEEDTETDAYEDIYIKKEIKEEPIDTHEFYERQIANAINKYKEINTNDELKHFICSSCDKKFDSIPDFQNHLESEHSDQAITGVLEDTNGVCFLVAKPNDNDIYHCNCKLIFHSKEQYDTHTLKCKKCFHCDICNESYPGKVPYDTHFLIYHRVSNNYEMPVELNRCDLCGTVVNYVGNISLHWCAEAMAELGTKCEKCQLTIKRECQLNHNCVPKNMFQCTFCSEILCNDDQLKKHILESHTIHGERAMPTILKKSKRKINATANESKTSAPKQTDISKTSKLHQRRQSSEDDILKLNEKQKQFENSYHDYIATATDYNEQRYNNLMKTIIKDEPLDLDIETHINNHIIATASIKIEATDVIKEEIDSTEEYDTGNTDRVHEDDQSDTQKEYIRMYKCVKCNFFGTHRDYAEHKINCRIKKGLSNLKNIKCLKCYSVFTTTCAFVSHFVRHGCAPLQCFECDQELDNRLSYENHVYSHVFSAIKEDGKVVLKCNICNCSVKRMDYHKHWLLHIDLDSTKCETLDLLLKVSKERLSKRSKALPEKLSNDQIKLMYKILTAPKVKTLEDTCKTCCYCDKSFSRVDYVKIHIIEHLLTDAYMMKPHFKALTCQFCLESFQTPDLYKLHMRGHSLLKVYQCKLCSKTFSGSSNFSKHKKTHNVMVLVCDLCCKRFTSKKMLIRHFEKEHVGNENYSCQYCGKEFACTSYYKKHIRLFHLGPSLRYLCAICKQRFSYLKDKWNHMWKEHGERSVVADCPACDAKFRRYQDLKNHLKNNHMDWTDAAKTKVLNGVRSTSKKLMHRSNKH